jgi:hypothetical protein
MSFPLKPLAMVLSVMLSASAIAQTDNDVDEFDALWGDEAGEKPAVSKEENAGSDDFEAAWDDEGSDWGEDDWADDSSEQQGNFWGLSGFLEWRVGTRTEPAQFQDSATLRELRLELKKDWSWDGGQARVTGDLLFDRAVDSQQIDLEAGQGWLDLREAWVQQQLGQRADIKIGRQILTWGVGDLVFINDLFPKDWQSFLLGRDEQYLKAPSDALRLGWYGDAFNIDLIYTPRFDSDRYIDGSRLNYFSPLAGAVVGRNAIVQVDKPDAVGSDAEWALRVYRNIKSFEVALYAYDGFWKSPGGKRLEFLSHGGALSIQTVPVALFPALRVFGASLRGPVGLGILSAEVGAYLSRDDSDGTDPLINNDEVRALVGYEWELMQDTTLGLQYYVEALQDYDEYKAGLFPGQPARDEYRQLLTVRLTRLAMNQNLTMSLFAFYSPSDKDVYLRPKLNYKVDDNWTVEAGLNLFKGDDQHTFFGQFEDNSNIYTAIRYSF